MPWKTNFLRQNLQIGNVNVLLLEVATIDQFIMGAVNT